MPSIPRSITATFADTHKEPGEYADTTLQGFRLRIAASGVKSYVIKARIKGGEICNWTIGKHGAPWNATTARKEAERVLALMKLGIDPRDEIKQQKAARAAAEVQEKAEQIKSDLTLRKAFTEWCDDNRKTKESSKTLYQQVIFKHLRDWLDIPMVDITPDAVVERYDEVADQTVASANNCFKALGMLCNWAIIKYRRVAGGPPITANPVEELKAQKKWRELDARKDYIHDHELPKWWQAVTSFHETDFADMMILMIVTGLRVSEAAGLQWKDVDFHAHKFVVRDTKNGSDHELPMTPFVRELLEKRQAKAAGLYVFSSDKSQSGHRENSTYWPDKIEELCGVHFSPHGLRRTFSQAAKKCRIGYVYHRALLNHRTKNSVTEIHYGDCDVDDLREPLADVERRILTLAGVLPSGEPQPEGSSMPRTSGNVVAIRKQETRHG